jgi:MFS family permease
LISVFFFVPETLRALVGNGSGYANPTPTQWLARHCGRLNEEKIATIKQANGSSLRPKMNFLIPFIYFAEPDVFLVLWFNGILYTVFYCFMTSTTKQFSLHYPYLSEMEIGLCYLCMGLGSISGSFIRGRILDRDYRIISTQFLKQYPDSKVTSCEFPIFKARFRTIAVNLVVMQVVVILYGWMLQINSPLPVALLLQFMFGLSSSGVMNTCQTLLVDLFPEKGASITASNNLMRCLLGAISTVYIDPGIKYLGSGWLFTILGMALVLNNVCLPILLKRGPQWRQDRFNRQNKAEVSVVGGNGNDDKGAISKKNYLTMLSSSAALKDIFK